MQATVVSKSTTLFAGGSCVHAGSVYTVKRTVVPDDGFPLSSSFAGPEAQPEAKQSMRQKSAKRSIGSLTVRVCGMLRSQRIVAIS